MLGRVNDTQEEIDTGRAMVEADLRAYWRLPAAAKTKEFELLFQSRCPAPRLQVKCIGSGL